MFRAAVSGQYMRKIRLKGPSGTGSQFACGIEDDGVVFRS